MTCPKCGAENHPEGASFCRVCGMSLAVDNTTSIGLEQNLAAMFSYTLVWLSGLMFILLEKDNDFVRFHAMQSIVAFGAITAGAIALQILGLIPYIGVIFDIMFWVLIVLTAVLWILLMVKASQGERYRLFWAGDFAQVKMPGHRHS